MKLHAKQVAAFDRSGKWSFVGAGCDSTPTEWGTIRMREVNVGARRDATQQRSVCSDLNPVPADVGRLHAIRKSCANSRESPVTRQFRRLVAAFKHPLQAEADSEL